MRLSEAKVNKIAIEIVKGLKGAGLVTFNDETAVLKVIREEITRFLERDKVLDKEAREKIMAQKRNIPEGSEEWKVLYRKYYEEAKQRKGW
jgi:hypothetical protein